MSFRRICLSSICVVGLLMTGLATSGVADDLKVQVGKQTTVLPATSNGLQYFPDESLGMLSTHPLAFLCCANEKTYFFFGRNWQDVRPISMVIDHGEKGSFDNGYVGVGGVYKAGHQILAFYHAEDRENIKSSNADYYNIKPFIASIGVAVSNDGGRTFRKLGQVLTSKHPRKEDSLDAGIAQPTVCVDKTNQYLMMWYVDSSRYKPGGYQICVARCPITEQGQPGHWKKYCNGDFSEPGLAGDESHLVLSRHHYNHVADPHVTYCKQWDKYLMVFSVAQYPETLKGKEVEHPKISGIYLATSSDGMQWDEAVQVCASHTILIRGLACAFRPTLIIETSTSNVVRGLLIYSYTPQWPESEYMVRRPITISKISVTNVSGRSAGSRKIPSDAVAFGGHHYKVVWEPLSWTEAKEACTRMGGRLACIETDEEKTFLADLKGNGKVVWVGAQRVSPDTWEWLNGKSFDPSKLGRKSPPGCDYVALHKKQTLHSRPVSGHDDRYPVKDIQGYICEWK